MCTMIAEKAQISGNGKGQLGWFALDHFYVSYDHPFSVPLEHALNIDFVNEEAGPGARVAVELTPDSARRLASAILSALDRGEQVEREATPERGQRLGVTQQRSRV